MSGKDLNLAVQSAAACERFCVQPAKKNIYQHTYTYIIIYIYVYMYTHVYCICIYVYVQYPIGILI